MCPRPGAVDLGRERAGANPHTQARCPVRHDLDVMVPEGSRRREGQRAHVSDGVKDDGAGYPARRDAHVKGVVAGAEAGRNAMRQRLFRLRKQLGVDAATGSATLALAPGVAHDLQNSGGLLGDLRAPESPELDAWLDSRRAARRAITRHTEEARIEALEAAGDVAGALFACTTCAATTRRHCWPSTAANSC